jgi:hypothetical protein
MKPKSPSTLRCVEEHDRNHSRLSAVVLFCPASKGDLMKAKSASVLRCMEEALRSGQRAAIAQSEADMIRELEMMVAWLEVAKSQALNGNPSKTRL